MDNIATDAASFRLKYFGDDPWDVTQIDAMAKEREAFRPAIAARPVQHPMVVARQGAAPVAVMTGPVNARVVGVPTAYPASPKQMGFLANLLAERELAPGTDVENVKAMAARDGKRCSRFIDELLTRPHKARTAVPTSSPAATVTSLPDVPEGRYAVDGEDGSLKFYTVDRPTEGKWAGYTFVSVWASDEKFPIRGLEAKRTILTKIAVDPPAAMKRFGTEIGKCGRCGRTLTDELSRQRGIGPDCWAMLGW